MLISDTCQDEHGTTFEMSVLYSRLLFFLKKMILIHEIVANDVVYQKLRIILWDDIVSVSEYVPYMESYDPKY